ncbi:GPP34 family phosphoprotein [Streptomyces sp. NBC_00059]|uniref:GOLPH3/VPS74 family protein n=1 Tax=Streptomyces sp. NBC_00059 TaxID=2975635 RepID=UPI002259D65C|nr:GPP34 family phosphoprotein [Streptomyces sp. NBC_00059]MCX5410806.1 GPP34 family phosphoprotein [Streptomyces sp. NBC_00059]
MNGAPTLPEELLLLALDPVRGKPYCRGSFLEYGIAGAVLAELELQGRVTEERGRVVVVKPLDPPDPLLAVFLRSLPAPGRSRFGSGVSAQRWVRQTGRRAEGLWLDDLVERGVLRRETRRFIGLFPYHRHPEGAGGGAAAARQRFEESRAAGHPDRGGRLLAALAAAVELPSVVKEGDRRTRAAARALAREEWPALAVHRNVRQDKASQAGGGDGGGGGGGD